MDKTQYGTNSFIPCWKRLVSYVELGFPGMKGAGKYISVCLSSSEPLKKKWEYPISFLAEWIWKFRKTDNSEIILWSLRNYSGGLKNNQKLIVVNTENGESHHSIKRYAHFTNLFILKGACNMFCKTNSFIPCWKN